MIFFAALWLLIGVCGVLWASASDSLFRLAAVAGVLLLLLWAMSLRYA